MKLPNINYQWNVKDLTLEDSAAPVRVAAGEANLLGQQAATDAKWASAANADSNTSRAWGKVYEAAGSMPNEMAQIAEKYDSSRADARMVSKMTQFSKRYDDPSKKFFTPEELEADGIKFDATAKDTNGQDYQRTEIPKHEIYQQAQGKYSETAVKEAESEFGWLSYNDQWKTKTQMAVDQSSAQANKKAGHMAMQYLGDAMNAEVKAYTSQGEYGAALKALEGCAMGNKICNAKRLEVVIERDIGNAQDSMISGDTKSMEHQRALIASGKTAIPKSQSLGIINRLNSEIKRQGAEDKNEFLSNNANTWLEEREGQSWKGQEQQAQEIQDPDQRKEVLTQMKARRSSEETNKRIEQEQQFNDAYKSIEDGAGVVPAYVTNGKDRNSLQKVINATANGAKINTDPATWGELHTMAINDKTKDKFAKLDLTKYAGKISPSDLKGFYKQQTAIKNQDTDTGLMSLSNRIQDSLFSSLGVKTEAGLGVGENRERYFQLNKQIEDSLIMMREEGTVTRDMENAVIADSISSYVQEGTWLDSTYDVKDFSKDELVVSGKVFKAYNLKPTNKMRYIIKEYPDLAKSIEASGRPVTTEAMEKIYEMRK